MPPRLKVVAEEILMCGLKSIPVAGKAFEVIDAVLSRHSMLAHGERLEEIERQMSRVDRRKIKKKKKKKDEKKNQRMIKKRKSR